MYRMLMGPGLLTLVNHVRSASRQERTKLLFFACLAGLFWIALFAFSVWVLGKFLEVEVFGIYLVRKLMSMLLLAIFSLLTFSNLVGALSGYFLADDLPLIHSLPVSLRHFHRARFTQTFLTSSFMAGAFGLPVLLAYGVVFQAPAIYYGAMVAFFLAFLCIPTGLGVGAATLLVSILPARRTRDLLLFVSFAFVIGLLVFLRYLQPEKLVNANDFSDMMAFLTQLQSPSAPYLPAAWGTQVLSPLAMGQVGEAPYFLALTILTAGVSLIVSGWMVQALYLRAYTRAQEGAGGGALAPGWVDAGLHWVTSILPRPMQAMVVKDLKSFFRDSAEWTQLLLVMALMAIYLYSIKVLPIEGPMMTWNIHNVIAFLNLGMVGFVMATLAVRFLFTSVSVEGRAFWILQAAPLSPMRFLLSKFIAGLPLLLGVGLLLISVSNWMLDTDPDIAWMGLGTVLVLGASLAGLSVGMGALYPNFKVEHVAKIASGPGGILFMVLSISFVLGVIVMESVPLWLFLRAARRHRALLSWELTLAGGLVLATFLALAVGGILPLRAGAKRLSQGG